MANEAFVFRGGRRLPDGCSHLLRGWGMLGVFPLSRRGAARATLGRVPQETPVMHPFRSSALLAVALWGVACHSPVEQPGSTLPGRCQAEAPVISAQKTDI